MDRIVACSSGSLENVAISLIRCSGFEQRSELESLFKKKLTNLEPKKTYLLNFYDENSLIDKVIAIFYDQPNSYTGENLLEILVHGNSLNRERILKTFLKLPEFRLAQEGEFSKRAYFNNKINLFEVEGLDLLLNAKSTQELDYGKKLLFTKEVYDLFDSLKNTYKNHRSIIELCLDFSEDLDETKEKSLLQESFLAFKQELEGLQKKIIKKDQAFAPKVLLYGPTNAGKSTLFNALLEENRALVSSVPGTTRDYISEKIQFHQITFTLIDSAGLRETKDFIEQEGINFTERLLKEAFFKILVLGPDQENSSQGADLIVYTHADQGINIDKEGLHTYPGQKDVFEEIFSKVYEKYKNFFLKEPQILLTRHGLLLDDLWKKTQFYEEQLHKKADFVILLTYLQEIEMTLFEITGEITSEETLNHLFSSFCIGK